MFGVAMGAMGVITIYVRLQFGWQEWETSKYVSIVNSCRVLGLLIILPLVTRLVRGKKGTKNTPNSGSDNFDLFVIRAAILFDMLGYLGYSLVRNGDLFILSGAVASFGGMGSPTLGSSLTKHVPPDRVGQLLGATGLLHAFARVVGPTIFNGIYSASVYGFRQTVFVCLTVTFGLAFMCSLWVRPGGKFSIPECGVGMRKKGLTCDVQFILKIWNRMGRRRGGGVICLMLMLRLRVRSMVSLRIMHFFYHWVPLLPPG
jgi:uncharacterized membrane protein AbrB (regulator of aidB expression)